MRLTRTAAAFALLLAAPSQAKELWEVPWIEVRTPHFVIASAQGEEKTRALAQELEDFRTMVVRFSNLAHVEERIPTRIFLVPRSTRDLGFDAKVAGYFQATMRANYAAIAPAGAFSDEVLKHEYVHFLVRNQGRQLYPAWFDEGFADFFATLRVRGLRFEYGKPMDARMSWLLNGGWLSYETVLETRDTSGFSRDRGAMFYAQSYLLVHYLMLEHGDFGRRNADYVARRERGQSPIEAFEAAFDLDAGQLTMRLARYLPRLAFYKGKLKKPLEPVAIATRPLSTAEVAASLGGLALHVTGVEAAEKYFAAALAADPEHGAALTGTGDMRKFAGRFAEAKPYYERAIALEPTEANHELDYGEYFLDLAKQEKDEARRAEWIIEARRHFARSYRLNPDHPETLAMNGATYLVAGDDVAKGVESLEVAHQLLPSQTQIRVLLAQGYAAVGRTEAARRHLEALLAWSHADGIEDLQRLLKAIDEQAEQSKLSASPQPGDG